MSRVLFVHLRNDYSGSPRVLSNLVREFARQGMEVEVLTSKGGRGFLSDLPVRYRFFPYRFFENRFLRLLALLYSQLYLFFQVLRYREKEVVVYVNTLLPFGAALAGRLSGKRVIYHLHEASVQPALLRSFLLWIARITAEEVVYVSAYLQTALSLQGVPGRVVYNALDEDFLEDANQYSGFGADDRPCTVLMLCSLKEYKGVSKFVELARRLPGCRFELVLSAPPAEVELYFKKPLPANLSLFSAQPDVRPFYRRAHLVLNLSDPGRWVETFGMTLLEGMAYGRPVIAPPAGGPLELVRPGKNGYLIAPDQLEEIETRIRQLEQDRRLYQSLCIGACRTALSFQLSVQTAAIRNLIEQEG